MVLFFQSQSILINKLVPQNEKKKLKLNMLQLIQGGEYIYNFRLPDLHQPKTFADEIKQASLVLSDVVLKMYRND
jgi:hypothetical protein